MQAPPVIARATARWCLGSTGNQGRVQCALFGLLLFVSPQLLDAQEVIGDAIACTECQLTVSHLVTLGSQDGPGALAGGRMSVAADSRGRYWVNSPPDVPLVFDSGGAFLRRISRRGEGPGEFQAPSRIAPVGDSMLVYDGLRFQFSVFSPDLEFVRSVNLRGIRSVYDLAVVEWPGKIAINALQGSADYAGWPLHFVSMVGPQVSIDASFGRTGGVLRPATPSRNGRGSLMPEMVLARGLAVGPDGSLWASDVYDYTLASWSGDGVLVEQWRRSGPLLAEREQLLGWNIGTPDVPPDPETIAVRIDGEGRPWIYTHVPAPDWEAAWTEEIVRARSNPTGFVGVRQGSPGEPISPRHEDLYATMVEVLDTDEARVLAREVVPAFVIDVLHDGRLAAYREDAIGVPFIEVYSVVLKAGQ